jgi:hypothetical protein
VGVVAVAASIIAVVLILNPKPQNTTREVARRESNSSLSTHMDLDTLSAESKAERLDHKSLSARTMSLSESLSDRPESESKSYSDSRVPKPQPLAIPRPEHLASEATREHLAEEERMPTAHLPLAKMSAALPKEWPNVSAAAALADRLYLVDSGRLYEVNPADGSRRSVGNDNWQNTAAMAATGKYLYLVSDSQLYEVDPKTGVRRSMGKPDWTNTQVIVTSGGKLYIASNGWLHQVNPSDGSHEVLHRKTESLQQSPKPKP